LQHSLRFHLLLGAAAILVGGALPLSAASGTATQARIAEAYGKLPLSFEANEGQTDEAVKFLARGQGYTLFLTPAEAVLSLHGPRHETAVVRMQVVGGAGGHRAPRVVGLEPQATKSNYFLGNNPSQWHTGVSHYARVGYEDVYPGIDLVYRGNQRQLEYDFVIAAGADPGRIRLAFQGVDALTIGEQGELVVHTGQGDLLQHAPVLYQEVGEERKPVEGSYVLLGGRGAHRQVGFVVGRYDRGRPLIIDPVLVYSTFLGGSGLDQGNGIAVDGAGYAYITGQTNSTSFPGVNGSSLQPANGGGFLDVFVTKLNPAGTAIVYSTFLGGSDYDTGSGIAVDGAGNAYVTGLTYSSTFPVSLSSIQPSIAAAPDAFVTKINPTGTAIVYSTFLGSDGGDDGLAIAVDGAGNAYITGDTTSPTFPGVSSGSIQPAPGDGLGAYDGFVTKINATGTAIVYSTFLGGNTNDFGNGIAVDGDGNAYIAGGTSSTNFPGVSGSSIQPALDGPGDAFVTKINAAGTAIVYSTYLGGSGVDDGFGIAVDGAGNAYVAGSTASTTFPGVNAGSIQPANGGGSSDAFVTEINSAGTAIVYSTFLGGSLEDQAKGIAVDGAGDVYVTGQTASTTFPGVDGSALQSANGGGSHDAFVTKVNPAGTAILYSTFLGGSGNDGGLGIAVDSAGSAYVTGNTDSTAFPGVNGGSLQPATGGGSSDGFVTKISDPVLAFHTVTPCRVVDTRDADGPLGGPALQPGAVRVFVVTGLCGVPSTAQALSVNVTVTQPTAAGYLRLLPNNQSTQPLVSSINFALGQTRANNAIALLASDGSGGLQVTNGAAGSVHFILDVNGYFE